MKQAGFGVGGASGLVDSEGDLDRLGVDEQGTAGQRNAADPQGGVGEGAQRAGEILHVVPCGHVVGVAGLQLVVQALHQLILCSGCDYLHASLHALVRPPRCLGPAGCSSAEAGGSGGTVLSCGSLHGS